MPASSRTSSSSAATTPRRPPAPAPRSLDSFSHCSDAEGSDSPVTLRIQVVDADKLQNPLYMRIWGALVVQLEWESGSHETAVREHTAHPVWDETVEGTLRPQGTLRVTLVDKDWLGLDIPVGTQTVKVRDLLRAPRLDLALTHPDTGEVTASLLLRVGRKGNADDAVGVPPPKRLVLRVGQGRRLGGPFPLLHPRVVVKVGDQRHETLGRPLAPVVDWSEDLDFASLDDGATVHVHLKDGPATIARGRLTVRDVRAAAADGVWLGLKDADGRSAGDVHVALATARPALPASPPSSTGNNGSAAAEEPPAPQVPVRLVRATNAAFGASGPLYCLLRKGRWATETLAEDAGPNMVWNADVPVPLAGADALEVEVRQAGAPRSLGRATVPHTLLTSGEREVWVHLIAKGRRGGELCLSLASPPLTYRPPRRPPAAYPSTEPRSGPG